MISSQRFNSPGPCGLANWSPSQQPFQRKIPCSMVLYFIHSRTHPWWGTDQEWRRDTKGVQSWTSASTLKNCTWIPSLFGHYVMRSMTAVRTGIYCSLLSLPICVSLALSAKEASL
ncbi:hypothetical protein VULLAG_LOCUS8977 [Vulpes lagopus]